jgi:ABC-type glycerol-3-phosphate transport system substrate-binding protein
MQGRRPIASRILLISTVTALMAFAAACQSLPGITASAVPSDSPILTPTPYETAIPTPTVDVTTLTLWLPPVFRSDSNSPGGNILNKRIEAFEEMRPGMNVVVRIKAASGTGGLRDSLAVAAAAAPGSLPDLVALDQSNLRAAAIKNLIYPLDGLLPSESWDSIFPYAKALVVIDDLRYGLPFSGDALILASTVVPYPEPEKWGATGTWTRPIFLPLGDSRALFLFFGYYAAGGSQILSSTNAEIRQEPLTQELAWLAAMQEDELLAPRSLQIDSFEGSFLAIENIGECSATLYSIVSKNNDYFMTYLPTPEGAKFSLATGWAWAVATSDPARQAKAAELMIWLSDPQFLAEWAQAQGVLPPSSKAIDLWPSSVQKRLAAGISEQAFTFPDDEISAFAGPVLSKAVRRVLLEGIAPADAAQEAAKAIHP